MEEETLLLHATHLAREGGWLQILRKIGLAALCQMVWSKISNDVGQCGVKRGWRHLSCYGDSARERALSFCNPWFLNTDSFNLSRETEDAFIFFAAPPLFFFTFLYLENQKAYFLLLVYPVNASCVPKTPGEELGGFIESR